MGLVTSALLALLPSHVAAAVFYPLLRRGPSVRLGALLLLAPLVLAAPLIVPQGEPASAPARWLVAVLGAVILFKLWDLHLAGARLGRREYAEHVLVLTSWNFAYRRRDATPSPPDLARAALAPAAGLALGIAAAWTLLLGPLSGARLPFLVEHGAKALALILAVTGFMNLGALARARLTGRPTLLPFASPLLAATPAEFWRRWNRSVSEYLLVAVYRPVGGFRHPARGTLTAFAVSGLLHEYIFAIAIMELQGYQLAFFAVHGLAVVLTARLRPQGPGQVLVGRLATGAFLLLTSVLFFAPVARVVAELIPLYPRGGWLP